MLDDRKIKVLYAVINSHLSSAEPIGSRTISKEYDLGVSAATIRNEMSDLEDKGFLMKPHSSAGRVPSDKAYRLYVNELLKRDRARAPLEDSYKLRENLYEKSREVEHLIINSTKLLSRLTSYTALALSPQVKKSSLNHIQLIKIRDDKILMVVVNSSGVIKNSIFKTNTKINNYDLQTISNILNSKFVGLKIDEIILKIKNEKLDEVEELGPMISSILPAIKESLEEVSEISIYSEGVTKILNFPEYNNIEKAKNFISFIENEELVADLLLKADTSDGMNIVIGGENTYDVLQDCSVITANYSLGESSLGKIGIIGPRRMDYFKLINVLNNFSRDISEVLSKIVE